MRAGDRRRGVRLAHGEQVGDVADVVAHVVLGRAPDKQKVVRLRLVPEERRARHVVVQHRLRLPRLDAAKLHERRLVGDVQHKRLAELRARDVVVLAVLLAVVVHQQRAHAEVRQQRGVLFRVLTQHKVARVLQRQVARAVQHLARVLRLALAVLLARRVHLGEVDRHVRRELDHGAVPRARLVLREAHLVERQLQLDRWPRMAHHQLPERLPHAVAVLLAQLVHPVVRQVERIELARVLARFEQVRRRVCAQQRHLLLLLHLLALEDHLRVVHVHDQPVKRTEARHGVPDDALEKVLPIRKLRIARAAHVLQPRDVLVDQRRRSVRTLRIVRHNPPLPVVHLDIVHHAPGALVRAVRVVVVKLHRTLFQRLARAARLKARARKPRGKRRRSGRRRRCVPAHELFVPARRRRTQHAGRRLHLG